MDLTTALEFVGRHRNGVLTTIRNDTRPQQSNIIYHRGDDGVVRISITADRAKYVNLSRRPWAALHVSSEDFWQYDAAVEELVTLYRHMLGEHEDWADYRRAMVRDRRAVVRLRPTRAYGMLRPS